MSTLRRASIQLRNRGLILGTTRIHGNKSGIGRCYLENYNAGFIEPHGKQFDGLVYSARFYNALPSSLKACLEVRSFSSEASGERDDDLENAFGELEIPQDVAREVSEPELSEVEDETDIQNKVERLGVESDVREERFSKTKITSAMTEVILATPAALSLNKVLDKWVEEGNEVTQIEVSLTMIHLRQRQMFVKALQLSEWFESTKHMEFTENNYASHVDLIAKVRGLCKAEEYIEKIPESFRGEIVYSTLLANCVAVTNVEKSEEVFNKMKNSFPITCFSCNQLLLLYKKSDTKKIADVLSLMEKENIKPSVFTYHLLIDEKGKCNDISGMEQVVDTMRSEGVEPSAEILVSMAGHYASCGFEDKAKVVLKEIERYGFSKNRWACHLLLPVYAALGSVDGVGRIWEACKSDPRMEECIAAIEAWGQLKRIEDAEVAFEKMLKKVKRPASKHFAVLLNVYANHKMLDKGKDLVRRMEESGNAAGPYLLDALLKTSKPEKLRKQTLDLKIEGRTQFLCDTLQYWIDRREDTP